MAMKALTIAAMLAAAPAHANDQGVLLYAQTQAGRSSLASADYYLNTLCIGKFRMSDDAQRLARIAKVTNPKAYNAMWAAEAKGPISEQDCIPLVESLYGVRGEDTIRFGFSFIKPLKNRGSNFKSFDNEAQAEICADVGVCN